MVARELAESRSRAQALIAAGLVRVDGVVVDRPARFVSGEADIVVAPTENWASRGALKLLHALDAFGLSPEGATVLDLGASTGGFTDVSLRRGARRVIALDVGQDQLVPRLRADPRVVVVEGANARDLDARDLPAFDWITADLSFISLEKALPPALGAAAAGATLVALVKPQFEVGRAAVGKGGVVRDPAAREAAVERIMAFLRTSGWPPLGAVESPIPGGDGNREWLVAARRA